MRGLSHACGEPLLRTSRRLCASSGHLFKSSPLDLHITEIKMSSLDLSLLADGAKLGIALYVPLASNYLLSAAGHRRELFQ